MRQSALVERACLCALQVESRAAAGPRSPGQCHQLPVAPQGQAPLKILNEFHRDRARLLPRFVRDTTQRMAEHEQLAHPDFDRAFQQGQVFRLDDHELAASVTDMGHVKLPTGRVEVVDPLLYSIGAGGPLLREPDVAPGRYRVQRSDAEWPLAFRVVFSEAPAIRWREHVGVEVDSGTIAFADASALSALSEANKGQRLLSAVRALPAYGGQVRVGGWGLGRLRFGGMQAMVVSVGADGAYRCFWGIDGQGQNVSLVVDPGGLYGESGPRIKAADLYRPGPLADPGLSEAGVAIEVLRASDTELCLQVDGYDPVRTWELRKADGSRANHGKLFHRDRQTLTFSTPTGLPEGAYLFISLRDAPMEAVDS